MAAVRINPGNIGGHDKVGHGRRGRQGGGHPDADRRQLGLAAEAPLELAREDDQAEALVEAALEEVRLLESSTTTTSRSRSSRAHVPTMIRAYRMLAEQGRRTRSTSASPRPGTPFAGSIKSAIGIGALLVDGIGDTIRVSLTADPVEEVEVAWEILKALGLRERGPIMIACPSCGRDNVGVQTLAEEVEERLRDYPQALRGRGHGLRGQRPRRGGRRRLRHRRRARRRLHLRARARAAKGGVGDPRRRALPRDRPLDRGRHGQAGAPEACQAGRAHDGRSGPASRR